jgi:hypothetical protein
LADQKNQPKSRLLSDAKHRCSAAGGSGFLPEAEQNSELLNPYMKLHRLLQKCSFFRIDRRFLSVAELVLNIEYRTRNIE